MASNDGYVNNRNVTQQRIEVKKEIENADSSTEVRLLLIKGILYRD